MQLGIFIARLLLLAACTLPWLALGISLEPWLGSWWLLALPGVPHLSAFSFLAWASVLARLWPGPPPGLYVRSQDPSGFQQAARALLLADLVQGSLRSFGLERLLAVSPALFRLYLRALGAECRGVTIARDVVFDLPGRLRAGTGAYIGSQCRLSALLELRPGRLLVGDVRIGRASFVGAGCTLTPESRIGERCFLGFGSVLAVSASLASEVWARGVLQLAPGASIGPRTRVGYRVLVGAHAEVGSDCRVGDGVIIGRRARLGDRVQLGTGVIVTPGAVVPPGARVAAGTRFPPETGQQESESR